MSQQHNKHEIPNGTRPCPFCGSTLLDWDEYGSIMCCTCGTSGPIVWRGSVEQSIREWNRRARAPRRKQK